MAISIDLPTRLSATLTGVWFLHVLVGEDDGLRNLSAVLEEAAGAGQIARADLDIVAPLGQVNTNGLARIHDWDLDEP